MTRLARLLLLWCASSPLSAWALCVLLRHAGRWDLDNLQEAL